MDGVQTLICINLRLMNRFHDLDFNFHGQEMQKCFILAENGCYLFGCDRCEWRNADVRHQFGELLTGR